jgi:TolA-binding protein
MKKIFVVFFMVIITSSCIKTAEQVQREKRIDSMSEQVSDTQGLLADMVAQMKSIQKQLDEMNGRIEELEHRNKKIDPLELQKMNETIGLIKTKQDADSATILQVQNEMKEHRAFIEKVTASLAEVKETPGKNNSKKKSAKVTLEEALTYIKRDKFSEAREILETLVDHQDLTPGEKNKVLHGLGKIEYYSGNPEKAMVYFSKIFTKFPRASLAPSSLLFIGRSLNKMGKKDEARQAFQQVLEDYKGSKEANEAKKEL